MAIDRYFLDMLSEESVSLRRQTFVTVEGVEYAVGDPWRRSYVNNTSGRIQVKNEVPEPYKAAIFAVWGESPTVADPFGESPVEDELAEGDEM